MRTTTVGSDRPDLSGPDSAGIFGILFDRYADALHRYLARRVGETTADDLLSETFLIALHRRHSYDPAKAAVRTWLYGIATNLIRQHVRAEIRALELAARAAGTGAVEGHDGVVAERVDAQAATRRLATALTRLSPGDRDVLLLVTLAALYGDVHVDPDVQTRARTKLMHAAGAPELRRRLVPIVAFAAAVSVVAVGAVVIVTTQSSDVGPVQPAATMPRPPATSDSRHAPMPPMPDQPQNTLHTLAPRMTETSLAPGEYRYVSTWMYKRMDTEGYSRKFAYFAEANVDTWIPADQQQEWLRRARTTDNRLWIHGADEIALADRAPITAELVRPSGEVRARCSSSGSRRSCWTVVTRLRCGAR